MKSDHLNKLVELRYERDCKRSPSMPKNYVPKHKYIDTTSNGLTKCIIDWINFNGGMAERIGNTGRWLQGQSVTDVIGIQRHLKGTYIPGTGTNGTADISATISGTSIKIEVKIGADKMSDAQKEYKSRIENAGGVYFVAKSFDDFYTQINKFL